MEINFSKIKDHFKSDYFKNNEKYNINSNNTDIKKRSEEIGVLTIEAYNEFKKISDYIDKYNKYKFKDNKQWQHSGNLYRYFWLEMKIENLKLCGSSISVFADEFGIKVIIEFDGKQSDKYNGAYNIHNKYLETLIKEINNESIRECVFWERKKGNNKKSVYGNDYKEINLLNNQYEKKEEDNIETFLVGNILTWEKIESIDYNKTGRSIIEWIDSKVELFTKYHEISIDEYMRLNLNIFESYDPSNHVTEIEGYEYIGSVEENTVNNFLESELKLLTDSGNYDKAIYLSKDRYSDLGGIDTFFEGSDSIECIFNKNNLVVYMNMIKFEFENQIFNKYKSISKDYWSEKYKKIISLDESELRFTCNLKDYTQNRRIITSEDEIFKIKGEILLPKMTFIRISKYIKTGSKKYLFLFELGIKEVFVDCNREINFKSNNGYKYITKDINFEQNFEIKDLYFDETNKKNIEKQITQALRAKKSLILIGPPGTGKSKLSKQIAKFYSVDSNMVTANTEWTSYETIGGYKMGKDGKLHFEPGVFLQCFRDEYGNDINNWLLIDEINRADMDKAFGSFFSILSKDSVSINFKSDDGKKIEIICEDDIEEFVFENHYIIPNSWRIIASMNTLDKTSLFEMSYAFMRRFAFIYIGIPNEINSDIVEGYLDKWNIDYENKDITKEELIEGVDKLWNLTNRYRQVGPAIIEDIVKYLNDSNDWDAAISMYILPQFDGLEDGVNEYLKELIDLRIFNIDSSFNLIQNLSKNLFGVM